MGIWKIHFGARTRQTTFHHLSSHISLRYITAGVEYCLFVPRSSRTSIQIGNRLHTFFFDGLLPESGIYNILTMKIISGVLLAVICSAMMSCGTLRPVSQNVDSVESAAVPAVDTLSVSAPVHEETFPVERMEQPEPAGPSTNVVKPRPPMFGK